MPMLKWHFFTGPPFIWPDATNTGVQEGVVLTPYFGTTFITTPDFLIENRIISTYLEFSTGGDNATVRNCLFTGSADWGINSNLAPGITVEHCEIAGSYNGAIIGQGTFRRLNIHSCRLGIVLPPGTSLVKDCYIHDQLSGQVDPHFDGVFMLGGQTDCLIEDCWIDTPAAGGTACVFISAQFTDPIVNTRVNHCRLLGGPSYAMYNDDIVGEITGTVWTNNEMQRGGSGHYVFISPTTTVEMSGNVDAFTGASIDL